MKLDSPQKSYTTTPCSTRRIGSQDLGLTDDFQTSLAPTLPNYSPHSPLHHSTQFHQQNKLSARYINNKVSSHSNICNTKQLNMTEKSKIPASPKRSCNCSNRATMKSSKVDVNNHESNCNEHQHNISMKINSDKAPANIPSSPLPTLASKLICSCEKSERTKRRSLQQTTDQQKNTEKEFNNDATEKKRISMPITTTNIGTTNSKRLGTRNAATSPRLDMRKLGSLATVSASVPYAAKKQEKDKPFVIEKTTETNKSGLKIALEKSNSLGESKPLKQLRTTRSLSPRPPVRHQQAIIISDENEVISVKLTPPTEIGAKLEQFSNNNSTQAHSEDNLDQTHLRRRKPKSCRSEQTSPNTTDLSDIKFSYNRMANRSTGCLVYVPTDPWLKMTDLENSTKKEKKPNLKSVPARGKKHISHEQRSQTVHDKDTTFEINGDPWVKRSEATAIRSPKHDRFRQTKSFSTTKFDIGGIEVMENTARPKLQRSKSPLFSDDVLASGNMPLQSAPSSPHILKTPENPFSSAFSLNYPYNSQQSNSPPRSASFSPARINNAPNPFIDYDSPSLMPTSPPPFLSVAANIVTEQQKINRSYLDVCNPNLLQARHSFSSVSNQQREDELQLNIRRLSEQMRKANKDINGAAKISLSDRNVNNGADFHHSEFKISPLQINAGGADFSDYLKQFRCSEAKKAAAASELAINGRREITTSTEALISCAAHSSSNASLNTHKPQNDSLLETTC
ncbi:uncharacterized protein LOC119677442 [Teleopsis dalmanni]|uniref:uncharacterized protein LOC119677442 n=1 Tax=Teleopsis dalmanni TaxID=139649 RepID=UPI0018CE3D28|nr:uncharacterized protein LOC119677442 [Teleopsis dalmanni]